MEPLRRLSAAIFFMVAIYLNYANNLYTISPLKITDMTSVSDEASQ